VETSLSGCGSYRTSMKSSPRTPSCAHLLTITSRWSNFTPSSATPIATGCTLTGKFPTRPASCFRSTQSAASLRCPVRFTRLRQRLCLDENSFAIQKTVGEVDNGFDAKQAKGINALFEQFPDYHWNKQQESKLRTELYKALRPLVGTEKMIDVANHLLKLQRV